MKSLSCRDAGFDCDHIVHAENDNDLFREGEKHNLLQQEYSSSCETGKAG